MKGRTPPPTTPAQQKEQERQRAILTLDIPAARAWAAHYAVGMLGDDRTILIALHEVRAVDPTVPRKAQRESIAWLKAEHPESMVLKQAKPGPQYSKA